MTRPETAPQSPPIRDADLTIGPLAVWIDGRLHPHVDSPYDFDWLETFSTFRGTMPTSPRQGPSFEAEDLARFRQHLQDLALGTRTEVSFYPTEQLCQIEVEHRGGGYSVKVDHESGDTAEFIATAHDLSRWIEELSAILERNPYRSSLIR